ncbi:MAG: SDR family NAD(P)-dependent oxidoreductase [Pirellulales bacterium]|nr:SDR family NAD(P)-dependent oxidoreductase [Pirellulales bacterium]
MPTNSQRRYALVTGAGSGLGRAFCLRLAGEGWRVAVTDIDLAAAEETLRMISAQAGGGQAEHLDVTDVSAWVQLREKLRRDWPQLDLLINNAGICAAGEMTAAPLEDLQQVLRVNLDGVFYGCHTMLPWLKETAPGGQIVNIASIFGAISPPAMGAYCASKAAVIALSETLYGELRPNGIGVTVTIPGFFSTKLLRHGQFADDVQREIAEKYMQRSQLSAEEVVSRTLSAVERKKLYVVVGRKARWYWRLKQLLPTTVTRFAALRHRQQMQEHSKGDLE